MKINKHEIWKALIQLTLRCPKYIKEMFNSNAVWNSYFLIPWQSFYGKGAKLLENFFLQLWKCNYSERRKDFFLKFYCFSHL